MERAHRSNPALVANPPTGASQKTVVVLGAFRGGTSMVARVLQQLGVFMGSEFAEPDREYETSEDRAFQHLLHRRDLLARADLTPGDFSAGELRALRALVAERDAAHDLWGWKYPGTVLWCLHAGLERQLRNPHFVTVFRDPLAVLQHELDKGTIKPDRVRARDGRSFAWVALQYRRLVEHVSRSGAPHLLVSYERLATGGAEARAALVDALCAFLGPALPNPLKQNALRAFER